MSRVNLSDCIKQMREAAEATKPEEPFCWAVRGTILKNENWMLFFEGEHHIAKGFLEARYDGEPAYEGFALYTTPQPCPKCIEITKEAVKLGNYILELNAKCDEKQSYIDVFEGRYADLSAKCAELEAEVLSKEGMALVTKEDANNYCRILTLLGMEEEGSPVEGVERLISLREGMTCGDCNDTGWLENREEGRYPCTCMTEAEPYQILEAERDALTSALAAKTADFDRLCKDFDEHDAELKRIIAGLRAELAQAKIYMPDRSAEEMPKTEHGPCNFEYWRILEVTA